MKTSGLCCGVSKVHALSYPSFSAQAWVWSDPARRERLLTEWNRRFNSWVAPRHDGRYFQLPGLSPAFTSHWYQRNAVARIAAEPTVLLDHVVGAGKTGTIFMSAMELKRRGLVNQPWIVVPTHLIEQFGREVKQWYPAANVLVGAKGMDDQDRRLFVAQTATSDWDNVIVPQSVFERINVAPQRQIQYIQSELDGIEAEMVRATTSGNAPSNRTVKEVEKYKARLDRPEGHRRCASRLSAHHLGRRPSGVGKAESSKSNSESRASTTTRSETPWNGRWWSQTRRKPEGHRRVGG